MHLHILAGNYGLIILLIMKTVILTYKFNKKYYMQSIEMFLTPVNKTYDDSEIC